ncbi:MAG: XrtA system polysaccharide chain length determinant [Candidatus Binatia bacterium]
MLENGLSLELALDILRRRMWAILIVFSLLFAGMMSIVMSLPNLYTASASILVEGQQIPQDYIRTTVTMGLERRLQILNGKILSGTQIQQMVQQFDLYKDLRDKEVPEAMIIAAMRRDVGVEVKGRGGDNTVVFEVSYTGPEPGKAVDVASSLAASYIEGNRRMREEQADATSMFLQSESDKIEKRLRGTEQEVLEYKRHHMGEIPEQLDANVATLSVLQKQLEVIADNLSRARERQNMLSRAAEVDASLSLLERSNSQLPRETPLVALRRQLHELKFRFSDKHPDVIRLKQQIAAAEEEMQKQPPAQGAATPLSSPPPRLSVVELEQASLDEQIKSLTVQMAKVQGEIELYKQRIENTPRRKQELVVLTRDYNAAKDLYASLSKRLEEAKLANNLEQLQKAERFRLLEPAVYPQQPAGPKRMLLLLLGCALSLGGGAAAAVLWEMLDTSIHRVDDLRTLTTAPILGVIPQIMTEGDLQASRLRQVLGVMALMLALGGVVGASHTIAAGNEQLVRLLLIRR